MGEQIILKCEDSITGLLSALYDAFVYKKRMEPPYEDSISIAIGDNWDMLLFAREIEVAADEGKAEKVIGAIQKKLGFSVYQTVFYALCHFDADRGSAVFGYLVRAFEKGSRVCEHLSDSCVMRVMELSRKVSNECEKLMGFIRFRDTGSFLLAEIEPKCDVLPILQEHFKDRYPNESFIIFDRKRHYAVVHPAFQECFFAVGLPEQILPEYSAAADTTVISGARAASSGGKSEPARKDVYEDLWQIYFSSMAIEERLNEKCQNTLLPKWYRRHMTEFSRCFFQ